jgi:hypothetical protein
MAVFRMRTAITMRNILRTNPLPRLKATAVPKPAPTTFTRAIGMTSGHQTTPLDANTQIAAAFVAAFRAFDEADAWRKSYPRNLTKKKTKKLPVPGPKKPS